MLTNCLWFALRWSKVFHYVNTPGDDPPDTCRFEYAYAGKDVINGLFNMTSQLQQYMITKPTTRKEKSAREDALRFFVHFMGDVHQPLHICGKDKGGKEALVRWGQDNNSNLHEVWDGKLILKDVKDRFDNDPKAYLDDIVDMTSGRWQLEASNWTYCDPQWARDMNKLNCQYVWKDYDPHRRPRRDYSKHYFETMTGAGSEFMVQKLIAMGGVRMATILNQIYDPDNMTA
ncbi:hypothetical protein BGZ67_006196 [Mortierella alpina]|nr:hypothetical protein BGZ67_006196 [Mortierella alpina]